MYVKETYKRDVLIRLPPPPQVCIRKIYVQKDLYISEKRTMHVKETYKRDVLTRLSPPTHVRIRKMYVQKDLYIRKENHACERDL